MQVDQALTEICAARQALLQARQQLSRVYDSLDGAFSPESDRPLDEEARIQSAAGLALDELTHALNPIDRILGNYANELIELDDDIRSALLEEFIDMNEQEKYDDVDTMRDLLALVGAVLDRWSARVRHSDERLDTTTGPEEVATLRRGVSQLLEHLDAASKLIGSLAAAEADGEPSGES